MKFVSFVHSLLPGLSTAGSYRKAESYGSLVNSLLRYAPKLSRWSLKTVYSPDFLCGYHEYLSEAGLSQNTISFYITTLRSVYRSAVELKHLPLTPGLFSVIPKKTTATQKRALHPKVISRVLTADLSGNPRLKLCRTLFALSFYLQGMSFVDLAHLRRSDLRGNKIYYSRQKTDTPVEVSVIPKALRILKWFMATYPNSPYLLPLLTLSGKEGHKEYISVVHRQNRQLKELAKYLGLKEKLTTYSTRHSWATLAYHCGVNLGVVSQGMGHQTEEVTRTYLAAFGRDRLTHANLTVFLTVMQPAAEGQVEGLTPDMLKDVKGQVKEAKTHLVRCESDPAWDEEYGGRKHRRGAYPGRVYRE